MKPDRCKWVLWALLVTGMAYADDVLPPVKIEAATDLRREGRAAEQDCVPLLLEFSASVCSYCDLLEEEFLKPMLRNRGYDRRARIRQVKIDNYRGLKDFDGKRSNGEKLAQRYRVYVTPTVLFVDRHGNELAERLIGINTLDLYGGYLDQAIDQARRKVCSRFPEDG